MSGLTSNANYEKLVKTHIWFGALITPQYSQNKLTQSTLQRRC